jgi:hypothetical protein
MRPRYQRRPTCPPTSAANSFADEFEGRIRELLAVYLGMPATVIGERIGWPYSIRTLSGRVAAPAFATQLACYLAAGQSRSSPSASVSTMTEPYTDRDEEVVATDLSADNFLRNFQDSTSRAWER